MEWISLGTTTQRPEIDTDVLVFADNKIGMACLRENGEWWESQKWAIISGDWGHYSNDAVIEKSLITHWMPLPNNPKL